MSSGYQPIPHAITTNGIARMIQMIVIQTEGFFSVFLEDQEVLQLKSAETTFQVLLDKPVHRELYTHVYRSIPVGVNICEPIHPIVLTSRGGKE